MFNSDGISPVITFGRKGMNNNPNVVMVQPMILYSFLYNLSNAQIVFVSSSAIGLYMLYTIAPPIPNSVRQNRLMTEVNREDNPKY